MAKQPSINLPSKVRLNALPVMSLNWGSIILTKTTEIPSEIKAINIDSLRYCEIRDLRSAPIVFFTPTSLIRRVARAVDKFIKLIQAIIRINKATMENNLT